MIENAIQTTSTWTALTLIGTTCVVLIYLVLVLTSVFKGDRQVKNVLKIGNEEIDIQTKEGKQFRFKFKHHKVFWICVGLAYAIGFLLAIWYILMIPILFYLTIKLLGKVKMRLKKA